MTDSNLNLKNHFGIKSNIFLFKEHLLHHDSVVFILLHGSVGLEIRKNDMTLIFLSLCLIGIFERRRESEPGGHEDDWRTSQRAEHDVHRPDGDDLRPDRHQRQRHVGPDSRSNISIFTLRTAQCFTFRRFQIKMILYFIDFSHKQKYSSFCCTGYFL